MDWTWCLLFPFLEAETGKAWAPCQTPKLRPKCPEILVLLRSMVIHRGAQIDCQLRQFKLTFEAGEDAKH
jgi:hypothetical protein